MLEVLVCPFRLRFAETFWQTADYETARLRSFGHVIRMFDSLLPYTARLMCPNLAPFWLISCSKHFRQESTRETAE